MTNYNDDLVCYKTLSIWTAETLPEAFKSRHNTKAGTWAQLQILSGYVVMEFMTEDGVVTGKVKYSVENQPPLIAPKQYHRIAEWSHDVSCQLSFYSKIIK